jgi:actin-related protein
VTLEVVCSDPVLAAICTKSVVSSRLPKVKTGPYAGSLKVGFPGHMYPRAIVRSVVEKSRAEHETDTPTGPQEWVYKPVTEVNYQQGCVEGDGYENPCVNGIVSNWDAMQALMQHAFNQLKVTMLLPCQLYSMLSSYSSLCKLVIITGPAHSTCEDVGVFQVEPASTRILVTDPPLNSENNRIKMLELLYETFGFSRVLVQPSAVLALYSQGESSSTVQPSQAFVFKANNEQFLVENIFHVF